MSEKFTYMEEIFFKFFFFTVQVISILFFLAERVFYLLKVKRKKEVQELQKRSLSDLCLIFKCNICVYTSLKTQRKHAYTIMCNFKI